MHLEVLAPEELVGRHDLVVLVGHVRLEALVVLFHQEVQVGHLFPVELVGRVRQVVLVGHLLQRVALVGLVRRVVLVGHVPLEVEEVLFHLVERVDRHDQVVLEYCLMGEQVEHPFLVAVEY